MAMWPMPLPSSRIVQNHANLGAEGHPSGAHRNRPAPQTKRDQPRVENHEAESEIVTKEAADQTSRSEDFVQPRDGFLDGVCSLGENQEQENQLAFSIHKTPLGLA
jgi:hypothetical protein